VIECTTLRVSAKRGKRIVTVHVGIAQNVARRINEHKRGKVKATRGREIRWLGNSAFMSKGDALRLEIQLKKKSPTEKRIWAEDQIDASKD